MNEPPPASIRILIAGAGGFGQEVFDNVQDAIADDPQIHVAGFLDDDPSKSFPIDRGAPVLGRILDYQIQPEDRFVVAIGNPLIRKRIVLDLQNRGARFFSVIHPTAHIAKNARIGIGCIIGPFVSVGNRAMLEEHVVMVWYSSAAHNSKVGPFAVFSPYSTINGGALLDEGAFLGTHAAVNPLQRVGAWAKVGAGAIVYHDVPPHHLAMGNPAKARPMLQGDFDGFEEIQLPMCLIT